MILNLYNKTVIK